MTPPSRILVVFPALAAMLLIAASAHSEPKCPPEQRPSLRGCVAAMAAPRLLPPPAAKKVAAPSEPEVHRDAEKPPLERADRTLLYAELQRLESLLRRTAKNSPDRALLMRRLAEGYVELERLATLESEAKRELAEREQRNQKARPPVRAKF